MMPGEFNSAKGYLAFDDVVGRLRESLTGVMPGTLGYADRALEQRLLQRFVEIGRRAFVSECARRHRQGQELLPCGEAILNFASLSVELPSGRLRLEFRLLARSLGEFLLHWSHVWWNVILASLTVGEGKGSGTLLFGVGAESLKVAGNDAQFVEYCRRGPIAPLSEARRLIVQAAVPIQSVEPLRFEYARFPLFALMRANRLRLGDFLWFSVGHMRALGAYLVAVLRCPPISTLGRDFAYHAMLMHLNGKRLIASVVITNSNHSAQPLWMSDLPERRFRTHMVWYSQNTKPLIYADDPVRFDFPTYRHLRADVSWVWTADYASYLRSLGVPGEMHAIGPILWQLPQMNVGAPLGREGLTLVVFDVTPVRDEAAIELGAFRNYYSTPNMIAFLRGISQVTAAVERASGMKVSVLLKHKRGFNRLHDPDYIRLVEELVADGTVELIQYDANMYSLIGAADLVVVVPYSSPAYVAEHLRIPSVFFDPTGELLPDYEQMSRIGFASGEAELLKTVGTVATSATHSP